MLLMYDFETIMSLGENLIFISHLLSMYYCHSFFVIDIASLRRWSIKQVALSHRIVQILSVA